MQLTWKPIRFTCACGEVAQILSHVGISSDCQLVVQWKCLACHATPIATLTVESLIANAPATKAIEEMVQEAIRDDIRAHGLGIC